VSNLQLAVQFFLQIAVILASCQVVARVARHLGQPQVVAEMIAGVLLGPSLFGLFWPELFRQLFPTDSMKSHRPRRTEEARPGSRPNGSGSRASFEALRRFPCKTSKLRTTFRKIRPPWRDFGSVATLYRTSLSSLHSLQVEKRRPRQALFGGLIFQGSQT
jgi:hypothetical protein